MQPYIALIRDSENFDELIKRRPTAYILLTLIAKRARRTDVSNFDDLEIGEALIGDYETYGSTERKYRTDKEYLEKYHFSTFRATSKGTVAKLVDTSIFDPNFELSTKERRTNRHPTDEQPTTNKNVKNEKNVKSVKETSVTLTQDDIILFGKEFGLSDYEVKFQYQKYQNYWGGKQKNEKTGFRNWLFNHLTFTNKKKPDLVTKEDKVNEIPKSGPITAEQFDLLFDKAKGKK